MIQFQTQTRSVSKFNILAQPTQPMNIDDSTLCRLAGLSNQKQWILFTAECPRPDFEQFASYNVSCKKIIQMRPSQKQTQVEIVIKAIKSGNASAVVASTAISHVDQCLLRDLGTQYQCEVFFVESGMHQFH
ncbi:SulA-like leucine-rich domain-containing protein [Vibrio atypicus]|jgi:cell division inhibitor SulA|uniref:SulA-like leucine-rich domain-containing protein n=1 Tax=Vibrio atypicus TaxID=558271 RepID=UPI00135C4DC8|nr:SulA-like leucine-rich domain-containing protein [Vibrio atypicus]